VIKLMLKSEEMLSSAQLIDLRPSIFACVAWPVTTRITSQPRWMFLRMAVLVTLVLWLPDVYILTKGQPVKAVAFLFLMHLAIAVVTYNALVRLAPARALHRPAHRAQPVPR